MSKTLHPFGRVLFEELEQIAIRRGGFASLKAVEQELAAARHGLRKAIDDAADLAIALEPPRVTANNGPPRQPSLSETAENGSRDARKALELAARVAESVDQLGLVVDYRVKTSEAVIKDHLKAPGRAQVRPIAFSSLLGLLRAIQNRVQPVQVSGRPWAEQKEEVERKVIEYGEKLKGALRELKAQAIRKRVDNANPKGGWFEWVRRVARGLTDPDRFEIKDYRQDLLVDDADYHDASRAVDIWMVKAGHGAAPGALTLQEKFIRGAVIMRCSELDSALDDVARLFGQASRSYRELAEASEGVTAELWRLLDLQPDASKYEIFDVIEDGARKASLRMGSVGLAFSGGGIRSATFNLGFLQGLASLGLLKQFDYLSTVSGGGYIGGWFAAWVRREGGLAGDPKTIQKPDVDREAAERIAKEERRCDRDSKRFPVAYLGRELRKAAREIRDQVRTKLNADYDEKDRTNKSLPEASRVAIGESPTEGDIDREAAPLIAEAERRLKAHVKETFTRKYFDERKQAHADRIRAQVKAMLEQNREREVAAKRRRTAMALENVELQLNSRRHVQSRAERRWVSSEEVRRGREATTSPPPPLRRTVEEEPEPVYHLRAYSNYLAPKLGLLSIDTWTMFSVYLRNLMLNQFILLPMTLAAIALPRLLLLLFAAPTTRPALAIARGWLSEYAEWPTLALIGVATVAMLTAPKLVDLCARWIVRRIGDYRTARVIPALLLLGLAAMVIEFALVDLPAQPAFDLPGLGKLSLGWLKHKPWIYAWIFLLPLGLVATFALRSRGGIAPLTARDHRKRERLAGWTLLLLLVFGLVPPLRWLLLFGHNMVEPITGWLTGDLLLFVATFIIASIGFHRTYRTVALIRESRLPAAVMGEQGNRMPDLPFPVLCEQILIPMSLVSLGVSLLFSRPGNPYFLLPLPVVGDWFKPAYWHDSIVIPALGFGALVGAMRLLAFVGIDLREAHRNWRPFEWVGRAASAFASGLVAGSALAAVLMWLAGLSEANPGAMAASMMCIGPLLVMIAIGAGSAIEVGLIGDYGEEDMREWRASLWAYLLLIGVLWMGFSLLSVYGPLLVWMVGTAVASLAGVGWAAISGLGASAGRSPQTDGAKSTRNPMEYVAAIAPPVFIVGLVIAIAILAAVLQGIHIPTRADGVDAGRDFLNILAHADPLRSWTVMLASAWLATIGCVYVNINLFALNAFYANRLVRCYLGASRPREAPSEGRPTFAPTNSPVPIRQPNPITGFDPTDDFPIRDLIAVRSWREEDLVVDYRGPYHLVNTAMNLVAGSELAWQERMAESFILSPLYCGSKTTGYRRAHLLKDDLEDDEVELDETDYPRRGEVPGYGDNVRLGTAVSVSGAAASPNAGYHSSPLVTILMTVFNARLGLWFGNPARNAWRKSGPGFALYLFDELFGRTTSKGKYVYLSDGGHFENLGAYELVRRRCRSIVICDAGADPNLSFWDLGGLVRKCREDFGVRIEIDVSPILRKPGTAQSQWHCAVGRIHYEDVDTGATPGTLFYIKPTLTGDEPSDVRNYVVDHPTFPHESTADQFFSESQFESYRVLGEHVAIEVFDAAVCNAGRDPQPASLFSQLRREWFPPPPNLDKNFQESIKPFVEVHRALRGEGKLERLSQDLYPELKPLLAANPAGTAPNPAGAAANPSGDPRAEIHTIIQMLQAMEIAWMSVSLDNYSDHPLNRGWMNVFRRWTSSRIFQTHWPAVRGEFSEGFVRFCEDELNLTVAVPEVIWLDPAEPPPHPKSTHEFRGAVVELDKEFSLEWPDVILREIRDRRSGLVDIFDFAVKYPVAPGKPKAGLVVPGTVAATQQPTSAPPQYGLILAWKSSDGVIDLVVWLRGAYRTLGLGDAVKGAIKKLKDQIEAIYPQGYILRARYPRDNRSKGKQGWQGTLWTDFFQNQGFHHEESARLDEDWDALIYRFTAR